MKLEYRDGLLFVTMILSVYGQSKAIPNMLLDTGAAHSVIDLDLVEDMGIAADDEDVFVYMEGIGGLEVSLHKLLEGHVQLGEYTVPIHSMDFSRDFAAKHGVSGLLGTDILVSGRFVIDLATMELRGK